MERAYGAFKGEQRPVDAAKVGVILAYWALRRSALSVAAGWESRVEHLLEGQPESDANGWLEIIRTGRSLFVEMDLDVAIAHADKAIELGTRFDAPGVTSLAMSFKGIATIQKGDWREGVRLVDESTVVAMSEKGDLRAASDVYCNTISVCHILGDYRRAGEWTDEAERWMKLNSIGGYTGICQVHRAELKRLRGSWVEAEEEARKACSLLQKFKLVDGVGAAYKEIGEVRRRMGDFDGAEQAFAQAYETGESSQPGRALLLFDRGDAAGAAKSIAAAIDRRSGGDRAASVLARARLLPAQIEIAFEMGEAEIVRSAVEELESTAQEFSGLSWEAAAVTGRGTLQIMEGDHEAIETLGRAWRMWQELDVPYEAARTRVLLGRALAAAGDDPGAELEFATARRAFEQLGATVDLERLTALYGGEAPTTGVTSMRREERAFMFTDLVASTDLIGLIGDDAWESLLEWHDRTLRESFASHGGEEVRHTGDGFFVSFDEARPAVDCAVDIQRTLGAHRRNHGFAPWVRIGVHVAEATRKGGDFAGQGVHEAARVGAIPGREEIVVSAIALTRAGALPYGITRTESVALKGIAEPLEVSWIDWSDQGG
jgi:class 3 adenylate cyclase